MRKILFLFVLALGVGVNAQVAPSSQVVNPVAYSLDSISVSANVSSGDDSTTTGYFEIQKVATGQIVWIGPAEMFDTAYAFPLMYSFGYVDLSLEETTDYRIRLNTTNNQGSHTSAWKPFMTPLAPGAPVITNIELVDTTVTQSVVRVHYSTLNAAILLFEWDYDGAPVYDFPEPQIPVVGVGYHDFTLTTIPDTSVFVHVTISGQGINEADFDFRTPQIVSPVITGAGVYTTTDSSATMYVVGDMGSSASGDYSGNLMGGGNFAPQSAMTGDTVFFNILNLLDSTEYTSQIILNTVYGADTVVIDFMTNPAPPPPPAFIPYTLASAHVGSGKVRFITSADTTTTLYYEVTEENGCNATNPSTGSFSVPRGIDTFFVQLAGADSLRIQAWLEDNLGDSVSYETLVIDVGPVTTGINLDLSLSGSYFQGNTFTVDLFHNESTQVYSLSVELADNTYTVIANPNIIYQDIIEVQQTGMNVTISSDFGGAKYMRVLAEPLSGLGPCGEGGGISDWEPLPNTATGINDVSDFKTSIYPNPFNGSGTIESEEDGVLQIYDMLGKVIFSQDVIIGKNLLELQIEPSLYFYSITNKAGQKGTGNIIVQ